MAKSPATPTTNTDAFGQLIWLNDTNGNITLHRYDAKGNRTEVITLKKGRTVATPASTPTDVDVRPAQPQQHRLRCPVTPCQPL